MSEHDPTTCQECISRERAEIAAARRGGNGAIYPVPRFIRRFETRVDAMWQERWRQQHARKDHERHAKFSHLTTAPCGCSNCDPNHEHYFAWLEEQNRRKWAGT